MNEQLILKTETVKLPYRFVRAFKAKMEVEYKVFLTDEQVNDIWLFFDCVKDVEYRIDPDLSLMNFQLADGKQYRFNKADSNFIDTLRSYPAELRIRAMNISVSEMENALQQKRESLVEEFKQLFLTKPKYRETGEKVEWKVVFEEEYEYYGLDKMTMKKFLVDVKTGKITIDFALNFREQLLDEFYV